MLTLYLNTINIDKYSLHKQKFFEVLNFYLKSVKGSLDQKFELQNEGIMPLTGKA